MCVIAHQPIGTTLTRARVKRLWDRNPDGGGFSYVNPDGELVIGKTMHFTPFWKEYREAYKEHGETSDFLLHMRIATHGTVDLSNVHPFQVDDFTVVAHNGVISEATPGKEDTRSDTRVFVEEVLPELPDTWLDNPVLVKMMEKFIGGSKLMFLTSNPNLSKKVYILNKRMGSEHDGMWFSNSYGVSKWTPTTTSSYQRSTSSTPLWSQQPYNGYSGKKTTYPAPKKNHTVPRKELDWEYSGLWQEYIMDTVKDLRKRLQQNPQDVYYMHGSQEIICASCYSPVDEVDGSCNCNELFCTVCFKSTKRCVRECFIHNKNRKCLLPGSVAFKEALHSKKVPALYVPGREEEASGN